eukprot:TRINITY_DN2085_c0_g1_i1.p2 TRINITY_DN2085_c0_g1~~TRINITY_DN2085_c0_g1_i1.p2  ORF type:complete len:326 (-),score=18.06 TRINITY_DN2085_c0_g1_i1:673-1650(-)
MQNLPGQVITSEEDQIYVGQPVSYYEEPEKSYQKKEKIYNVLGFKYPEQILLQRNKNPVLLLVFVFLFNCVWPATFMLTYVWSSDNPIAYTINMAVLVGFIIFGFFTTFLFLQQPLNNNDKIFELGVKQWIFFVITLIFLVAQLVKSFLYRVPFYSLGLYLLCTFGNVFFLSFTWILTLIKNEVSFNENNYQLKFFAQRFFSALIVTFGFLDPYSDFALALQAVSDQYDVSLVIILVPALLIFGVIDLLLFILTIRYQLYTCIVVNKIVLIVINAFTILYLREESLIVGWFSLVTTVISFVYYIYKCCCGKKREESEKDPLIVDA